MKRLFLLACTIWLSCLAAISAGAAVKVTGQVVDDQDEPIIGASVTVPGTNVATVTDYDGHFTFSVPDNAKAVKISYIGFKSAESDVKKDLGIIKLIPDNQLLNDVIVTQAIGKTRVTPVAMSNVDQATIDLKLGQQEFPEILKTTPGVYTNKQGGGYGDAETACAASRASGWPSPSTAFPSMTWRTATCTGATGPASATSPPTSRRSAASAQASSPLLHRRHHRHHHPHTRR